MKFAKELEQDLVPEWRAKYLDYRIGKKKLKAVARAIRNASKTPQPASLRGTSPFALPSEFRAPVYNFINQSGNNIREARPRGSLGQEARPASGVTGAETSAEALSIPGRTHTGQDASRQDETSPLRSQRNLTRYGSIIGSPPDTSPALSRVRTGQAPSLKLPGPALESVETNASFDRGSQHANRDQAPGRSNIPPPGPNGGQNRRGSISQRHRSIFHPKRVNSMPGPQVSSGQFRPLARRMFSLRPHTAQNNGSDEIAMDAYKEIDARQAEFFMFLDKELEKVEKFYREKEDEATHRLKLLREQLHIMRDKRMEEVFEANMIRQQKHRSRASDRLDSAKSNEGQPLISSHNGRSKSVPWLKPVSRAIDQAKSGHVGKTFQAMRELGTPNVSALDLNRDYTRRPTARDVPYRQAKQKLKVALAEYYRGLELLKSFALLNRTAFRKINKKFDKTVNARPSGRYMAEKVNRAYFVESEVLDGHLHTVEDLYARYFERGSHKIAVGKLRAKAARAGDFTRSVFRNGIMLAVGAVFGIEGLVYGAEKLWDPDPTLVVHTSYLLQIYAGCLMVLLLSLFFCLACRIWHNNKVNYQFIFEFDTRHSLDWRQLSEIPSFLTFLLGLTLWLNFKMIGHDTFYIYWPVVFIFVSTVLVVFNPLPIFYHRSRAWFAYSNWRLFFAGLYPVEFRDFFLGDLFCSLTYAMGNIGLFICLYAQHPPWNNPPQCNSSHLRILGFLTCLPGIWRLLQCLRRYRDTRNVFPHLVNGGKYTWTILYYMSISLFRIDQSFSLKAFFIFCATINAVYCSIWDVVMDWSLLDPYAKHPFLRKTLAFKSTWPYYLALILDPILRFNWIFYAIYAHQTQHSTIVSFLVTFSEVCRRGMWMIFRVENEHCTNVGRFRASRDVPLPYDLPDSSSTTLADVVSQATSPRADHGPGEGHRDVSGEAPNTAASSLPPHVSRTDIERLSDRPQTAADALRRRRSPNPVQSPMTRALTRVGTILHTAHAQDFERKRKPELGETHDDDDDDDDEDDDEEGESDSDVEAQRGGPSGTGTVAGRRSEDNDDESPSPVMDTPAERERIMREEIAGDVANEEDIRETHAALNAGRTSDA